MDTKKLEEIRTQYIADLEEQIWKKEVNAAFDESRIPLIKDERQKAIDEVVKISKEGKTIEDKAFVEKDHSKETRIKIKQMKNDILRANQTADACEDTIATIINAVRSARIEANGLKKRIEFVKAYGNETSKN